MLKDLYDLCFERDKDFPAVYDEEGRPQQSTDTSALEKIIDEVLAVGDEAFQRKCLERIKLFQRQGRTILLVTHAADLVRQICDRAAVLDHGNLVSLDDPGPAVAVFRDTLLKGGLAVPPEAVGTPEYDPAQPVRIVDVGIVT